MDVLRFVIVLDATSKIFEYFDAAVFALGGLFSGHSIEHVVAALAPLALLYCCGRRRLIGQGV